MKNPAAVLDAQRRIAAILAELETNTGMHVEAIAVVNDDITQLQEAVPRWSRRVEINIRPTPGSNWITS